MKITIAVRSLIILGLITSPVGVWLSLNPTLGMLLSRNEVVPEIIDAYAETLLESRGQIARQTHRNATLILDQAGVPYRQEGFNQVKIFRDDVPNPLSSARLIVWSYDERDNAVCLFLYRSLADYQKDPAYAGNGGTCVTVAVTSRWRAETLQAAARAVVEGAHFRERLTRMGADTNFADQSAVAKAARASDAERIIRIIEINKRLRLLMYLGISVILFLGTLTHAIFGIVELYAAVSGLGWRKLARALAAYVGGHIAPTLQAEQVEHERRARRDEELLAAAESCGVRALVEPLLAGDNPDNLQAARRLISNAQKKRADEKREQEDAFFKEAAAEARRVWRETTIRARAAALGPELTAAVEAMLTSDLDVAEHTVERAERRRAHQVRATELETRSERLPWRMADDHTIEDEKTLLELERLLMVLRNTMGDNDRSFRIAAHKFEAALKKAEDHRPPRRNSHPGNSGGNGHDHGNGRA